MMYLETSRAPAFAGAQGERFLLDVHDVAPGDWSLGRLARALFAATGIRGESLQWFEHVQGDRFEFILSADESHRLVTPLTLPFPRARGQRDAIVTLRRDTDPLELAPSAFDLTWDDDGPLPTVGAIAVALHARGGGRLSGDDVALCLPVGQSLRLTLSAAAFFLTERTELTVAGRAMVLSRVRRS